MSFSFSFKEYVKIGYADDVERRLKELNRSECMPFAFRFICLLWSSQKINGYEITSNDW